ncbi:hypothetical protein KVA01_20040 [Kocuria varians]|uniref:Uncharacterized protein n=1 Tax=Kocuria varians TaxID=1272 RepID=A0A4Y4D7B4_KOCVA|nr:hypothetical protein KVA01_20040 [Kocuria varians]
MLVEHGGILRVAGRDDPVRDPGAQEAFPEAHDASVGHAVSEEGSGSLVLHVVLPVVDRPWWTGRGHDSSQNRPGPAHTTVAGPGGVDYAEGDR